jgi:hypothetical protein
MEPDTGYVMRVAGTAMRSVISYLISRTPNLASQLSSLDTFYFILTKNTLKFCCCSA